MQLHKLTLIILFFNLTIHSYGQDQKVIKKKEDTENGKATYFVLQSDPMTYHGRYYIVAWTGNEKIVDGNYLFGKKQGLWTERYYRVSKKKGPKSIGQYKDDLKTGKWIYFSISGDTSQVYDYTTNELIYSNECNQDINYNTKTENGFVKLKLDCPPIFKGGRDILFTDLTQQALVYPKQLEELGMHTFEINTKVILTIDTTGKVSKILFSKQIGYGYEEKIEKWVLENGNDWIPGELNKQKVEAQVEIPIRQRFQF